MMTSSTDRKIQHFFDKRAKNYEQYAKWATNADLLGLIRAQVDRSAHLESCLDIGTGKGVVGALFKDLADVVIGVDISSEMLRTAKGRLAHVVEASVENVPFSNDTFDLITCRQVLHYTTPQVVIREMKRLIRPTGIVLISQQVWEQHEDTISQKWIQDFLTIWHPLRRTIFSTAAILNLLVDNGFSVESEEHIETRLESEFDRWISHDYSLDPGTISEIRRHLKKMPERVRQGWKYHHATETGLVSYMLKWVVIKATPAK